MWLVSPEIHHAGEAYNQHLQASGGEFKGGLGRKASPAALSIKETAGVGFRMKGEGSVERAWGMGYGQRALLGISWHGPGTRRLTAAQPLRWDANAHAAGSVGALRQRQRLALGQLQAHEKQWVGARDGVFLAAQLAFQHLALIPAQLPWLGRPRARVAQWEHEVAEGRDGELRALV